MGQRLETFLRRAEDYSRGMGLLREDDAYVQSAALLAIHAAISYADALRTGLGDSELASENHQVAAKALRACVAESDLSGVSRLERLLSLKSPVTYGERRIEPSRLRLLCVESERFALWANRIGRAQVPGWRMEHD